MTEYYVSTSGYDTNNGTSPSTPWRHIQYGVNHLSAGDTLFIMDGTYQEMINCGNNGTENNYITLSNYNGGSPIIDGSWMTSSSAGLISLNGSYLRFTGLKIANSSAYGFFCNNGLVDHIRIDNCELYGCSLGGIQFYPGYGVQNPDLMTNVIIENNNIHNNQNWWNIPSGGHGGNESVTISNVDGFILRNNYLWFNHKLTIDCKNNARNGQIYNNIIDNYATPNHGCHGIYIDAYDDHAMDIDIFNNIVYGPYGGYTIGTEQGGRLTRIHLFNNIYYGIVYPDVTSSWRHAFQINNHWTTVASDCVNVSCSGPITNCCGTPGIDHLKKDCSIINNTVYNASHGFFLTDRTESFDNFIFRNNCISADYGILIGSGQCDLDAIASVDHNLFTANTSDYWGSNYIRSNPLFVDPSNHDFHLQATSPCINAGSILNAPTLDFDGKIRGSEIDIGAYEYEGFYPDIDDYAEFIIHVS